MKKCYIAGKISTLPEAEYTANFEQGEREVHALGMVPVSPLKLDHSVHDAEWVSYMKTDLRAMLECDCVYALRDWGFSKGAKIEIHLAISLGIEIVYQQKLNDYDTDDNGRFYKMIDGKKIYQVQERTQADRDFNDRVNEWRQRPR